MRLHLMEYCYLAFCEDAKLLESTFFYKIVETDFLLLDNYCSSFEGGKCFFSPIKYVYFFYIFLFSGFFISIIMFFVKKNEKYYLDDDGKIISQFVAYLLSALSVPWLTLSVPEVNQFPLSKFASLQHGLGQFWFLPNLIFSSFFSFFCFEILKISRAILAKEG